MLILSGGVSPDSFDAGMLTELLFGLNHLPAGVHPDASDKASLPNAMHFSTCLGSRIAHA